MDWLDVLKTAIPAAAALLGVAMSEMFGRWKRREKFESVLFDKKFSVYSLLVGIAANMLKDDLTTEAGINPAGTVKCGGDDLLSIIMVNRLIVSVEVSMIVLDFLAAYGKPDVVIVDPMKDAGVIQDALYKRCQKELGLKALTKSLEKLR